MVNLDEFLDKSLYDIYGSSPVWSILPKNGFDNDVYTTLKNHSATKHFRVYRPKDIPAQYHYSNNRRILSIFLEADEGWDVYQNMNWKPKGSPWGNHGYNNSLASMRPLFVAHGPAFKKNYIHNDIFDNVDLYPLMNHILELFPINRFPSNGSFDRVSDMLASSSSVVNQSWLLFLLIIIQVFRTIA